MKFIELYLNSESSEKCVLEFRNDLKVKKQKKNLKKEHETQLILLIHLTI